MATLTELERAGVVHKLEPGLAPGVQQLRLIHASTDAMQWLQGVLPGLGSTWNLEVSPLEQVVDLVDVFCRGDELAFGPQFHCLHPAGEGVWELKTADVRIFGWFHSLDCFVAVKADSAERVKEFNLYRGYVGEVVRFRGALNLNEPKFVPGDDPYAVVSNYYYP